MSFDHYFLRPNISKSHLRRFNQCNNCTQNGKRREHVSHILIDEDGLLTSTISYIQYDKKNVLFTKAACMNWKWKKETCVNVCYIFVTKHSSFALKEFPQNVYKTKEYEKYELRSIQQFILIYSESSFFLNSRLN